MTRTPAVLAMVSLVAGAFCTWLSLNLPAGDSRFVPSAILLAAVWAVGAVVVGLRGSFDLDRSGIPRAVLVGVGLCTASVAGGIVVRYLPGLADYVRAVLAHSSSGWLPVIAVVTAAAGIAEELFFRGALYSRIPRHPAVATTAIYALVTAASGNLMLVGAAVLVGGVTAYQRHLTNGVAVSIATHVVWAMTMLFALPALLG